MEVDIMEFRVYDIYLSYGILCHYGRFLDDTSYE